MSGPPPPPMAGPPPPTKGAAPAKDRSGLLKDLNKGDGIKKGLKKAQTNDRSSPIMKEEKGGGGGGPFGAIPMRLPGGGGPRPGGGAPRAGGPPRPAPGGGARPAPAVGGGPPRPAPGGGAPRPAPAVGGGPPRPAPGGGPPRAAPAGRMPPPSMPVTPHQHSAPAAPSGGGAGMGKCKAVYPFNPVESGDLGFAVGDIITIIGKDGDWWEGELNGRTGTFPFNYVTPLEEEEVAAGGGGYQGDVGGGGGGGETCTALYMFAETQAGDLSFNKGDVITIVSREGQWWQGTFNGVTGTFPANYVQLNTGGESAPPSRTPAPSRQPPMRLPGGPPAGGGGPPTAAVARQPTPPVARQPTMPPAGGPPRPGPPTGGPPRASPATPPPMRAPPPSTPPAPVGGGGPPPPPAGGGGLPPPPSGGPPPPTGGAKKIGGGDAGQGRGALLSSIEGFGKHGLKKAETVDKSAPILKTEKAPPAGGGGVGGLFAGGMPGLRPRGGGGAAPARAPSGPPAGGAPAGAPRRPAPGPTAGPPAGGAPPRVGRMPPPTVARAPPPTPAPAPAGPLATALYTYEASQEGDLSFAEGEKITIVSQSGNWWEGINAAGSKGVFPSNYVQLD